MDEILRTLYAEKVDYLLIGGMNFLLRHLPELTFDVDIWVDDRDENLKRLNSALFRMEAEWGATEKEWRRISEDWHWLRSQPVFCLTTKFGAVDIFREVLGLSGQYSACRSRATVTQTATGIPFVSLSDEDMLICQEALPVAEQKPRRIAVLREAIRAAKDQK